MPQRRSAHRGREFPEEEYPLQDLTRPIIGAAFAVHRALGFGFLESVYQRALVVELEYRGVPVAREVPYELVHRGVSIGFYRADIVVSGSVVVETKTGLLPDPAAEVQLLNYLCASKLLLGLVVHFGPRVTIKRLANTEDMRGVSR